MNESYQCRDCGSVAGLDQHGRCETCQSEAVISQELVCCDKRLEVEALNVIRIKIERIVTEEYRERKNFIVKSTPTEIKQEESNYSGRSAKVTCIEEYQTEDVVQTRTVTVPLLEQNITDESAFSLSAVIKAVNDL